MTASGISDSKRSSVTRAELAQLPCELLDAHKDAVELAGERALNERWRAHLAYLGDLERVGQEMLWRAYL